MDNQRNKMKKNLFRSFLHQPATPKDDLRVSSLHGPIGSAGVTGGTLHSSSALANNRSLEDVFARNKSLCGLSSLPSVPSLVTPEGDARSRQSLSTMGTSGTSGTVNTDEASRREARRQKVKARLGQYHHERKHLRSSCAVLEKQLSETAEKLKEVDTRASSKIDDLESELVMTRLEKEFLIEKSAKEVGDQTQCIKTLGKKLIKQAHLIKKQKIKVEEYRIQLEALKDEMAMQDERDSSRDEEYTKLKKDYERIKDQKLSMQHTLQENIEEMMDLKMEQEKSAARVEELERAVQEKETEFERMTRESAEKSERITSLERELEEKTKEVEIVTAQLKASERSVHSMKQEIDRSNSEISNLRAKVAISDDATSANRPARRSFLGWRRNSSQFDLSSETAIEDQLREQDIQIQSLDITIKANEDTIASLKSNMVKMSSTYKQDDYLKRKQIAQLKQANAEYALKLRALEKAFRSINVETSVHGSRHLSAVLATKEDRAEAVKERLGDVLSLKVSPLDLERKESRESLSSSTNSDLDRRKREATEEC